MKKKCLEEIKRLLSFRMQDYIFHNVCKHTTQNDFCGIDGGVISALKVIIYIFESPEFSHISRSEPVAAASLLHKTISIVSSLMQLRRRSNQRVT